MVQFSQYAYATGVRISWQESPESDVAGYKVYYGTATRDYDNVIDVGNVGTVDIGDLETTNYYFAITAYNASGEESDYSEEMQVAIGPDGQGSILPGGDSGASGDSAGSAGSSGGGGGGGCFIATSQSGLVSHMQTAVFLGIVGMFIICLRRKYNVH